MSVLIELADKFFNIYIAPGIMIALGLCFFFVSYLVIAFYVASWSEEMTAVMYYVSVLLYIFLLVRYVLIFRRRFSAYVQCMENYFSDDEEKRLLWVSRLFYYSLGIGILVLQLYKSCIYRGYKKSQYRGGNRYEQNVLFIISKA